MSGYVNTNMQELPSEPATIDPALLTAPLENPEEIPDWTEWIDWDGQAHVEQPLVGSRLDEFPKRADLSCNFPGCPSTTVFGRKADRDRHMKSHTKENRFSCTAAGCDRKGPRAFARPDKLTDHVVTGHRCDAAFCCPAPGCAAWSLTLPKHLFIIHAQAHKNHGSSQDPLSQKQIRAFSKDRLIASVACPVPGCSQQFTQKDAHLNSVGSHILAMHDLKTRLLLRDIIQFQGYDSDTCFPICPVCTVTFEEYGQLLDHLRISHID